MRRSNCMQLQTVRNSAILLLGRARAMAAFTQVLNPLTGQSGWLARGDDYDYHQEVANAGFGDMLHDWERNQKYFAALRKTIAEMHTKGCEAHVLDIGTGTGILSMMALQAGADSVTACEAFLPMANCAERILAANSVADRVKLIKKRSTDIIVGEEMPKKANLLVTEVLDTELIGEGAIGIYNHAHEHLLTDDAICIPARATCYVQVVQSPLALQWNSLKVLANLDGDVLLQPTKDLLNCKGEANLHDVQLSQLPLSLVQPLTAPVEIFDFDFERKASRETHRQRWIRLRATHAGAAEMVFYWWDIKMDAAGEIIVSCAPYWAHPELQTLATQQNVRRPMANTVPWRDHWMQAIYYIPKPLQLQADAEFLLSCNHDEYSWWFDAIAAPTKGDVPEQRKHVPRHACSCGLHLTYSRSRIAQLNQATRNKRYLQLLEDTVSKEENILVLGDGCLLGLAAAKLGAANVVSHEPNSFSRRFLAAIAEENKVSNIKFVEKLEDLDAAALAAVTHVFAEPYFLTAILPWDNFYFGSLLQRLRSQLGAKLRITPHSARIYALPVEFLDLHKIHTPVGNCEGFDLTLFDELVETAMALAQTNVEAQPLWEYPCRALALPQELLVVDFNNYDAEKCNEGVLDLICDGSCNGIALWVDWQLGDNAEPKAMVSTGPREPIEPGTFVKWDMFVRQGVHFISKPSASSAHAASVRWDIAFKPTLGQMKFNFEVQHKSNV